MTTTVKFYLLHSMFYNECLDCQELSRMHKNKFNYPFFFSFFNDFQSLDIQICLMYQLYEIKIALRFQQRFRWIFSTVVEWFPIILSAFPFELSVEGTVLHSSVWLLTLKKTSNLIHFPSWRQSPLKLKF